MTGSDAQMLAAVTRPQIHAPPYAATATAAKKAAQQFEAVFVSEFLGQMFEGISTDGPFGGGQGEAMFRSLMLDEYGKQIAASGGFGIANAVSHELLKHQEVQ